MRVARQDEGVDAERGVFADAFGHGVGVADERRTGAAAHEPHAGPEVGAHLELVAPAAVQGRHAALAFRVEARERVLGGCYRPVVELADERVGGVPRRAHRLPDDDVEADPEAQRASVGGSSRAHVGDLLRNRGGRLAPGEVHVHVARGQLVRRRGRAAKVQRRMRLLHGRVEHLRSLDPQVRADVVDGLAREDATPDREELVGHGVTLVVTEEDTVAFGLGRIAAGHDVDEDAAVGHAVQRCGRPR